VISLQRFELRDPAVGLVQLHLEIIVTRGQIFLHFT
jgi:hypothetical protein